MFPSLSILGTLRFLCVHVQMLGGGSYIRQAGTNAGLYPSAVSLQMVHCAVAAATVTVGSGVSK